MSNQHKTLHKRNKRFETPEERYYLTWASDSKNPQCRKWMRRTVIFHYSNGTNKCCVDGCDAPIEALTLEHENFDKYELAKRLDYPSATEGSNLYHALMIRGFPDVGITVKCMAHNNANRNPNHSEHTSKAHYMRKDRSHIDPNYEKVCNKCKIKKNQIHFHLHHKHKDGLTYVCKACDNQRRSSESNSDLKKAYALYGYTGDVENMTWEHSNNDGHIHKKYLRDKYGRKAWRNIGGVVLARLLLREYEEGLPNWPGLIVMHANDNHVGRKAYLEKRKELNKCIEYS
jgi:hypothetical protein